MLDVSLKYGVLIKCALDLETRLSLPRRQHFLYLLAEVLQEIRVTHSFHFLMGLVQLIEQSAVPRLLFYRRIAALRLRLLHASDANALFLLQQPLNPLVIMLPLLIMILAKDAFDLGLNDPWYVGVELIVLSQHGDLPLKLLLSVLPLQILIPLIQMQVLLMLVAGNSFLLAGRFLQFHYRVDIADVGL